jgi:hypothetical protein
MFVISLFVNHLNKLVLLRDRDLLVHVLCDRRVWGAVVVVADVDWEPDVAAQHCAHVVCRQQLSLVDFVSFAECSRICRCRLDDR